MSAAALVAAVFVGLIAAAPAQASAASAAGPASAVSAVSPASAASAASLAAANIGKTAGTCAVNPTHNTLGGSAFEGSCVGYAGVPEYWCADFAKWVWANSGFNVSGLTAAAQTFITYGESHGTLHGSAQPGDAIVYSSSRGGYADHVAIVTAVNSDGSVVTANGDWGGHGSTEVAFATTSSVVQITVPASEASTGSFVPATDYYITGIVGPSGSGGTSPPPSSGNPYSATQVCGSGYGVIDSHALTGAVVYLLYNNDNGNNCVVTLANADTGKVPMDATLTVQGGSPQHDSDDYDWYAGPVTAYAPNSCVQWGGTYKSSSWTSDFGHCGDGNGSPAPTGSNPYSASQACGGDYAVVDHHALSGATVYLLYSDSTGDNCVVTLATDVAGSVPMAATLTVQGGTPQHDSDNYTYYAGPVYAHAPNSCVQWGGTYKTSTWTSAYGHCGGSGDATANPYTPTQVCGAGYSVIDSHDLGSATVYLLYNAGMNCVTTMVHNGSAAVGLNATLQAQGGGSENDPGLYQWYAGPVRVSAPGECVKWGGTYESTSWTSDWSHCG